MWHSTQIKECALHISKVTLIYLEFHCNLSQRGWEQRGGEIEGDREGPMFSSAVLKKNNTNSWSISTVLH